MSTIKFHPAGKSAPKSAPYAPGMKGFFEWLNKKNPRLYGATMRVARSPGLAGLGITAGDVVPEAAATPAAVKPSTAERIREILMAAGQTYLTVAQVKAQQRVLDTNLKRAQQGLAPLDVNLPQYGFTGAQATVGLSSDTQRVLLWGAVIFAGAYLLPRVMK